jgi:single-strand DNA-binding protein
MSRDLNRIFLMGRLGSDPTPRETKTGTVVVTFPLATARWNKELEGEETSWPRVHVWGKQGEVVAQHLKKGDAAFIEGSVRMRKYAGKDGVSRMSFEVHADDVHFIGGRKRRQDTPAADAGTEAPAEAPAEPVVETEVQYEASA